MISWKHVLQTALALLSVAAATAAVRPNSEVLRQTRHVRVLDGRLTVTDTVVMLIDNKYGNETVSVEYDKLNLLKTFKAWVEDGNGNLLAVLPKKAFLNQNIYQESSLYADRMERICHTDYPVYPHRFVYTSTVVTKSFFYLAYWSPISFVSRPMHVAELWIHRPLNYPVRTLHKGIDTFSTDTAGSEISTHYVLKPSSQAMDAMNNPAVVDQSPVVLVSPEQFVYGQPGSTTSWSAYGNWVDLLNKDLTALPESERIHVTNLVSEEKNSLEQVRLLYHYLQDHTRYVSIDLGIGGMKSYPADYVSVNKFGDCKALSVYMKALLECVGIRSHLALVNREEFPKPFYEDYCNNQFNHVVLAVPLGKDTIWLENTSTTGAMGYVDVSTQNRPALLIDGLNSRLVHMPALSRAAVSGRRLTDVRIDSEGTATVSIEHLGRGKEYEYMNAVSKLVTAKSQFNFLDQFTSLKHYDMQRFEFKRANRDDAKTLLELVFRVPEFLQRTNDRAYLTQMPVFQGSFSYYKPDGRTLNYPIPVSQTDTVRYHLPPGWCLDNVLEPVTIECPFASYRAECTRTDDGFVQVKSFYVREGTYAPEDYKRLYEFIRNVSESDKKFIQLHTNSSAS